ncbi:MAG: porphobilinogen synthase, partial [Gammaproteobacteria bacterium]
MQFPDRKYPAFRARRMRRSAFSRSLMRENRLCAADFVLPIFVTEGQAERQPIASLPGVERLSLDLLLEELAEVQRLRIPAIALFPVISADLKSETAAQAWADDGLVPR